MSLSTISKGIELAIEVTMTVEVDIVEIGGNALSKMNCTTPPVNNWYNKNRKIHRGDFVQQFEEVRSILEKRRKLQY